MENWKRRLYDGYVSSGQAGASTQPSASFNVQRFPYLTEMIRAHIPQQKDIAIADLACGHGTLIHCLREAGYQNVSGVDASAEQVAVAHRAGLTTIECGSIQDYVRARAGHFDVIFLMDILEHLNKAELLDFLDMAARALKVGGKIVIHVPNAEGIFGMRIRYGDLTHENCFTSQSISQALNVCGFENIACFEDKPVAHGLKSGIRRILWNILTLPFRLLLLAETGTGGHILSQNMLVVARRAA